MPLNPAEIPLSLYIHIPWCIRKCPYCDFNSHAVKQHIDEAAYIHALLSDLNAEQHLTGGRSMQSIFIGGGTPSLFSAKSIDRLLNEIRQQIPFARDIEITLEANPGAADAERFAGYCAAGVNRLSIGIQSLQDDKLKALGRVHGRDEALAAIQAVRQAGLDNFNLDLMYGLPNQTLEQAMLDLQELIDQAPAHLSWYQLTLEPNTLFYQQPPALPHADYLADMMQAGLDKLSAHGYQQYEISAHSQADSQTGKPCRHNLNYWQFGDYLGIGAGAHGKLTLPDGRIVRRTKQRQPSRYMALSDKLSAERTLNIDELPLEFMLNAMRLNQGACMQTFKATTGLGIEHIQSQLEQAIQLGLLQMTQQNLQPTRQGRLFLNDLLAVFT